MRRINAMRDGAVTHTRQQLKSVSYLRALEAAEKAARWEKGAPSVRGDRRGDLDGEGVRAPCSLGARFAEPSPDTRSEVA
jgi:hypothetical protein